MSHGILFALLSLLFAGLNDVAFKRYSHKDRSRGMYIFGIGVVWTLLQWSTLAVTETAPVLSPVTLGYGLATGVLLTLSNILLLESLARIPVSVGSDLLRSEYSFSGGTPSKPALCFAATWRKRPRSVSPCLPRRSTPERHWRAGRAPSARSGSQPSASRSSPGRSRQSLHGHEERRRAV